MKIGVLQQVGSNLYIWVEKFLEVKITFKMKKEAAPQGATSRVNTVVHHSQVSHSDRQNIDLF